MLYEVAMICKPTQEEREKGKHETIVMKPTAVIADSPQSAGVVAIMENRDSFSTIDMSMVEVLVRPFA